MTSSKEPNQEMEVQIAEYLSANPDFFSRHEDLLAEIRLPHSAGNAISLIEKQQVVFRERNNDLRHRLSDLIDNARENDRLFGHTRKLILSLLDCKTLEQATEVIYSSFKNDYKIETTQIILFADQVPANVRSDSLSQAQEHVGKYLKARQTIGGGLNKSQRAYLFGQQAENVNSAAIAILAYGDLFGVIAIGNSDADYYNSSMGTMFLAYISEVLSRILRDLILQK